MAGRFILGLCLTTVVAAGPVAGGADSQAASAPASQPDGESAYLASIDKRAADIVSALGLTDAGKAAAVHDALVARYRELRAWHDENDPKLKELGWKADAELTNDFAKATAIKQINADRLAQHEAFLQTLGRSLSAEQIETVKDKLTYDKVRVTYSAYQQIIPNLTELEKTHILGLLKEAREEAMDGGSSDEKSAVFKRYKNRCKAYLKANGHDVDQDYKNWGEAQKHKAATAPAGN